MYKILTDRKLKNSLVKKGLAQTKRFAWEKTAQKTIQIYKKVFEDKVAVMNILLLRIDRLGDFILSINPITQLKTSHPGWNIDIVINKANYALAKSMGIFRKIIVVNYNSSKIKNVVNVLKNVKGKKYDYTADLIPQTNHLSSILQLLVPAKKKIGVSVGLRKYFLSEKIKVTRLKYETELVYDILGELVKERRRKILFPLFWYSKKEKEVCENILSLHKLKQNGCICLYPIIEGLEKKRQWPLDYYIKLIERILAIFPKIMIAVVGIKKDRRYIKYILRKTKNKRIINLTGKLTLLELIYLFNKCLFSVGGLAGASHVSAVICRRPSFCIVGGTPIKRWVSKDYPYIVIKKSPSCYPCEHLKKCVNSSKYKCLKDVSVADVMDAIKRGV